MDDAEADLAEKKSLFNYGVRAAVDVNTMQCETELVSLDIGGDIQLVLVGGVCVLLNNRKICGQDCGPCMGGMQRTSRGNGFVDVCTDICLC